MPYARRDVLTWQAGMYYHIYNRGVSRSSLFREPGNYHFVIAKLQKYAEINQTTVIAYCLMRNHYHFLLRQDGEIPAGNVVQSIFNSYSKAYNLKYTHSGTLFERRFQAKSVQTHAHLQHLCRYIHANPVKDGFVANPADWPWSNYLEWVDARESSLVDRVFIQEQFGSGIEYKQFLLEYLKSRQLPDDVNKFINELEN